MGPDESSLCSLRYFANTFDFLHLSCDVLFYHLLPADTNDPEKVGLFRGCPKPRTLKERNIG